MAASMTPNQPYLVRAIYEWVVDNQMTPYILVNANHTNVHVPQAFVRENKITLNISDTAVRKLRIGNDALECEAHFRGIPHRIYIPISGILAIYAKENSAGMAFSGTEIITWPAVGSTETLPPQSASQNTITPKNKPALRLIKNEDAK